MTINESNQLAPFHLLLTEEEKARLDAEQAQTVLEKEAKEQAEREKLRQEQRAKQMAERRKIELPLLKRIIAACKGWTNEGEVVLDEENLTLSIFGHKPYFNFDKEFSHQSSWRSTPTGKIRIVVGDYGDRTSYPQHKDGTHNYNEIAKRLVGQAAAMRIQRKQEDQRNWNKDAAARLIAKLGLSKYGCVRPSAHETLPILIDLKINQNFSEEQAEKLIATLREFGINVN